MKKEEKRVKNGTLDINREYSEKYIQKFEGFRIPLLIQKVLKENQIICDLGCGDGFSLISIIKRFPDKKIIGVDISTRRIENLKNKLGNKNRRFLCEDVCETSIKKNFVDLVLCEQVIEHVKDDKKLVEEVYRILKPNSFFYISSVIKKSFAWYKYKNRFGKRVLDPTHEREYHNKIEFLKLFQKKFKLVKIKISPVKRKFLINLRIPGYYIIECLFQKNEK